MVSTNIVLGKPLGDHNDPKSVVQLESLDPSLVNEYREIYIQAGCKVQRLFLMALTYTYEALYKMGCEHPALSNRIDVFVSYELRLHGYAVRDQVNILLYGPYMQSQMLHHHLSEQGARDFINERLEIAPIKPKPVGLRQASVYGNAA